MLKIKTEIKTSIIPKAGLGLFCIEFVKAGTLVWKFDEFLDIRVPELPTDPIAREFVSTYGYLQADGTPGYVVCIDNARFINHAEEAVATLVVQLDGTCHAAQDLLPGTELTHSYDSFCADDPAIGYKRGDGAFPRNIPTI
jgi:hypothetical protein